jgi:hypothetical protein
MQSGEKIFFKKKEADKIGFSGKTIKPPAIPEASFCGVWTILEIFPKTNPKRIINLSERSG